MKRVALALSLNKDFDRKIAVGVAEYAIKAKWSVYVEDEPDLRLPRFGQWNGDGLITNFNAIDLLHWLQYADLPIVCVGGSFVSGAPSVPRNLPRVMTDDRQIGSLAAEHLLDRELRHLAYCDYGQGNNAGWSALRGKAFARAARKAGACFHLFTPRVTDPRKWNAMIAEMAAWIGALPKPAGILAADDLRAHHLLEAARQAGVVVPAQAAVMGVDNDRLPCLLSEPPLTSIDPNAVAIGRMASQCLDRVMSGLSVPRQTFVPPVKIERRQSTNIYLDPDALVEQAMGMVGAQLTDGIQAGEVAASCGVTLVTLNKRFRSSRGMTVSEWIRRERLKEIRRLIAETNLPLRDVAARTGVSSPAYLCQIYRSAFGRPPRRSGRAPARTLSVKQGEQA